MEPAVATLKLRLRAPGLEAHLGSTRSSRLRQAPFHIQLVGGLFAKSNGLGEINPGFYEAMSHPEHTLISQLLSKVQDLEETNSRILNQQEDGHSITSRSARHGTH